MKKLCMMTVVLLVVMGALFLGACSSQDKSAGTTTDPDVPANVETKTFKLGHVVQVGHSWDLTAKEFARLIEERSDGRYKIEIYPARQLGGDRDMFEAIQVGSLDMGLISTSVVENFTPALAGLQLPWLFEDVDQLKEVYKSDMHKKMLDRVSEVNVKGLSIYDCGFRHFLNNQRPIKTPDDMKGLKFRSVESPLVMNMYKFLGASPTPTPYGEIYTAVQTNVVQGLDIGFKAGVDEKFVEVAKYMTVSNHFTFPTLLCMNPALFDAMPAEDQKMFEETALELIDYNFEAFLAEDKIGREGAEAAGVTITEIEDFSSFRALMQPIYDEYMAKDPTIKELVSFVESL